MSYFHRRSSAAAAASSVPPLPPSASSNAPPRAAYNSYTPRRIPYRNAYVTTMNPDAHNYPSSPEGVRGAMRAYPAEVDDAGYAPDTDDTATVTGNATDSDDTATIAGYTADSDDTTTLAGESTDTRDEAAASLAVDSDYMEVDEDLPVYRSHYVLPPLDLPDLPEIPFNAHLGQHSTPQRYPQARNKAARKAKKRGPPVRSLFDRLGVPLVKRLGPAPHTHKQFHRVPKTKSRRTKGRATAQVDPRRGRRPSNTVKSQDKVAPLPLSRTVRVGPIGRMGRSEFIALLKRVGPLASYWWDGAHVVARFEKAGDAKDAVQTFNYVELERGTWTKAAIVEDD